MLHRAPKVVLMSDPRVGDVPLQDCAEHLVDTRDAITATECEDGDCCTPVRAGCEAVSGTGWCTPRNCCRRRTRLPWTRGSSHPPLRHGSSTARCVD
jgi:hypothetical protein